MRDRLLRSVRRSAAALMCGAFVGAVLALPAAADDPAFTISDPRIDSPTGIATDTATSSYWMVKRDGGQLYALSRTGRVKGAVGYRADPTHVEAAAYRSGRLYVGDVGDPSTDRAFVSVYLFPNLTEDAGTVTYQRWDFSYPDGAHDAQALVVDGGGRLYLITRGTGAGVYAAPSAPSRQGVNRLERVGDAPSGVTDAVRINDSRWALRTDTTVTVVDADSYQKVAAAKLPVTTGGVLGLALAGLGSTGLVAASSGSSAQVYAVTAPSATTTKPSSSATGQPTSASTAGGNQADPPEDVASDSSRSGTILAVVLAGLVAVLAGVVAFVVPVRRRDGVTPAKAAPPATASTLPPAERPVAPDRHREPGDIEDDDPFDDTTVRADTTQPAEPPRRSLGYDPDLWGEQTLRRRAEDPGQPQ